MPAIDTQLLPHATPRLWTAPFRADFWVAVFDCFALWAERREQRLRLGAMDDRMLSDLGLDRGQIEVEISKPFWLG